MDRNQIENTTAFRTMPPFKQEIWRKAANMKTLIDEFIKAKSVGYAEWKASRKPVQAEDKIIIELLNNQNHELQQN